MGSFNKGGFNPSPIILTDLEVDAGTISVDATNNRVGIGVTDPDKKLEVDGAIHISGETTTPSQPAGGDGGILYAKADGKLYWRSNEVSENDLTAGASGGTSVAADNITAGDAAVEVETSSGNVLVDSQAGTTTIDGHTGVTIQSSNSGEVDITSAANVDINATTGVTIDGTTISIDGTDDMNFTITSSTAAEDLTIQQIGANDSSIIITAAGTGADAVSIDATAGSMVIGASLANAKTLTLGNTNSTYLKLTPHGTAASEKVLLYNAAGTADDAIKIHADAGGITIKADNDSLHIDADGTDADALNIDSAGGIDVDAAGAISLDSSAGSIDINVVDGQTVSIGLNGGVEQIIAPHGTAGSELYSVINTAGTTDGSDAAGSILLSAVAGGIGLAWADDKDLWAEGGQAVITANHNAASAIKLHADAGSSQTIVVVNDEGTSESAIAITSTAGGVDIDAAAGKDVTIDGGQLLLTSAHNTANAIYLRANAGTSETIKIHADQGSGAASIELTSDAGGIDVNAAGAISLDSSAGSIDINVVDGQTVNIGLNGAVEQIIAPHGTAGSELYSVINTAGTTDGTDAAGAILLSSVAGGIGLAWADGKDLWAEGGRAVITANEDAADSIKLHADAGSSQTITVVNDEGTSVTEGSAAVSIQSLAGGVELRSTANLANAINITNDGGTSGTITIFNDQGTSVTEGAASIQLLTDAGGIGIKSTANLANAVLITADGGTDETIVIHSDQGTGEGNANASIELLSDVGGICFTATGLTGVMTDGNSDAAIQAHAAAGGIGLRTTSNLAGAIQIEADGGTDETIIIKADQGSGADSIQLTSDAGGIALSAAGLIKATPAGFEIENASTAGAAALLIDNDDTDQIALNIEAANIDASAVNIIGDALTTSDGITLSADALTSGKGVNVSCSSNSLNGGAIIAATYSGTSTNNNSVLALTNDHASATATALINLDQDSTGPLIYSSYGANGTVLQLKVVEAALTLTANSSATTHDISAFLPAGSIPYAISGRVTTALAGGFISKIGIAADDDLFGTFADDAFEQANDTFIHSAALPAGQGFGSNTDLRVTTNAGVSDGVIRVALFYYQITAPTS